MLKNNLKRFAAIIAKFNISQIIRCRYRQGRALILYFSFAKRYKVRLKIFNNNKIFLISKFYRGMEILNVKKHGRTVPSFLKKTYQMLEESVNDSIVRWTSSGVGFMVLNEAEFSKIILPKYFKHSKYSSFVRQLNMYNFHKVRSNANENCFIHEKFIRNDLKSIENIKRKPERKKKKIENDQNSCEKQESEESEVEVRQSKHVTKSKCKTLSYRYPNHKITIRIANKTADSEEILLDQPVEICFKNAPSDCNTVTQKQSPATGIQLQDCDDNISIQDVIESGERSHLRITTRFLLQNQGSGIFPINTGMISIYSMSSLIK